LNWKFGILKGSGTFKIFQKFPEHTDSAFQGTLDSLNTTTSVTIDYINKEVKKESTVKNKTILKQFNY
jgi:hypothetical protein